ncbi:MAG: anti-sigma factor antagonist [Eubacteriales bacterium]|nr:anti-sigma factor antagonist [Clostridia bacterium]MDY6183928.1 anti-sigma factor antagonist [Eubacteriales bacterium]
MLQETAFVKTRVQAGVLECALCGEVDHHSARALREKLDTELFLHRPRLFLLSLEHISFMDSSGLGLILGRLNVARELACEMRLVKVSDRIRSILSLAGASRLEGLIIEEESL